LEIISEIKRAQPFIAVLIYTMHPEVARRSCLQSGHRLFIKRHHCPNSSDGEENHERRRYASDVREKLASHLAIRAQPQHDKLSERELQVMKLIARVSRSRRSPGNLTERENCFDLPNASWRRCATNAI
jgi:DNA-binding NarL/FixJ family response regulator